MTMGRPSKLTSKITVPGVEGQPDRTITAADRIVELMTTDGTSATLCADQVGVDRKTIRSWLNQGARAEEKRTAGKLLYPAEQKMLDFLLATRRAHAQYVHDRLQLHDSIARGGLTIGKIIEKIDPTRTEPDPRRPGQERPVVLERRVEQSISLPDPAALRWELERLAKDDEGNRIFAQRVELTGADGGAIEIESKAERAARLAAELRAYQQGAEDQRALEAERALEAGS